MFLAASQVLRVDGIVTRVDRADWRAAQHAGIGAGSEVGVFRPVNDQEHEQNNS